MSREFLLTNSLFNSSNDSIINCTQLSDLYLLFVTCSGVKIKIGMTISELVKAVIKPLLSTNRKSLLNMNMDLLYVFI